MEERRGTDQGETAVGSLRCETFGDESGLLWGASGSSLLQAIRNQ